MKRYQTMTAAALLTGALLLTACSQEDSGRTVEIPSDGRITFTASVGDNLTVTRSAANADMTPIALSGAGGQLWLVPTVEPTAQREQTTRGTQLGSSATLSTFGVSAFRHDADDDNLNDDKPSYFYNLQAAQVGETGVFTVSQPYYWPAAGEALTFNAYYPYGSDNVVLTDLSAETKNSGQQSFSVTVATSANDQVDFMTATAKDETFKQNTSPNVSLTFQHQLTAVRFVLGSQFLAGYIKSIAISGVYGRGIYTIGGSGNGWTVSDDDKTDVSISYVSQDRIDKQVDGTEGNVISADGEAFLLIPQTFEADDAAKITILYNDGYDDYTVEASLAGQQAWTAGTTVTYAISSEYLTTLRISELDYPETVEGAPKTEWAVGDQAGMYVVKPDGTTIEYENVPVTYVGGTGKWKWQITHPDGHTIYKLPGYSYYFYYPYVEGTPTGYALTGHSAGEAATDFFSGVITSRNATATTAYDDQGTEAAFTAADLQVAKAEDDVYASTVKATMERQVTMAVVTLDGKTLDKIKTYGLSGYDDYEFKVKTGTQQVTASAPTKLYGYGGKYYYWAKWGVNNVLSADGTDPWSATVNITAKNGVEQVTAQSPRTYVDDGTATHTLAVGDVYFSDGSVGATSSAYPNDTKTPVGIVFALSGEMSTADTDTHGFKHGYVFSLKDANTQGAGHQWTTLSSNDVSTIANVTWSATTNMATTEGVIKNINGSGQNGYDNTQAVNALDALGSYPAFQAVATYNSTTAPILSTAPTNSGWYLPSIAEWWLACKNLGNMDTSKRSNDTGWKDSNNSLWGVYYNSGTANSTRDAMNNLFKSKVGSGNYNPIQGGSTVGEGMSAASGVDYWSSSEWSGAGYAFRVGFYNNGILAFERYNAKSVAFRVRPVLAF